MESERLFRLIDKTLFRLNIKVGLGKLFRTYFFLFVIFHTIFSEKLLADEPVDLGVLFVNSFAATCSAGVYTQRALSDTNSLKRIVEQLKNDPACQDLNSVYAELIQAQDQLQFLQSGLDHSRLQSLKDYKSRLSMELATTTDPELEAALGYELTEVSVQILQEPKNKDEEKWITRQQAASELVQYIDVLNKNLATLSTLCFQRNKSLPIQFASQMVAISGGFFDPTVNLVLTMAGRLVSGFFDFFNNRNFNKKIADYQKTSLQVGLGCAMEALEQNFCDIQDRRELVSIIKSYRNEARIPQEWLGYELLLREYSTLQDFLRRAEAGNPPSSSQQGDQRSNFRINEGYFYAAVEQSYGLIGQAELELALAGDNPSAKAQRTSRLIDDIVSYAYSASSVIQQVIPNQESNRFRLWLRIGNPVPQDFDQQGDLKDPSTIISELDSGVSKFENDDITKTANIDELQKHLEEVFQAARLQLSIDRQLTIIPDAKTALINWVKRNGQGFTPEEVADRFIEYFKSLERDWIENTSWFASAEAQRDALGFLKDTRGRFESMMMTMKLDSTHLKDPASSAEEPTYLGEKTADYYKLSMIYDAMFLKEKDQVITDRVNQIVQMDMEKRLRAGLLKERDNLDVVTRLNQRDIVESLIPGADKNLEPLLADLDDAEPVVIDNLMNFFEHYEDAIVESLRHLKKQAEIMREDAWGVYHRRWADLCALAANDPQLQTRSNILKLCENTVAGYREGGKVIFDFEMNEMLLPFHSSELINQAPRDRLCRYRRFRNKIELIEDILRQRPGRFISRAEMFDNGEISYLSTAPLTLRLYFQSPQDQKL